MTGELGHLRMWKAEATTVITEWEQVWEALGRPGELGQFKSLASLTEVERLKARESRDAEALEQLRAALTEAITDLERAGMRPADWTIADELARAVRLGLAPEVSG